jgi:hypothetical protein
MRALSLLLLIPVLPACFEGGRDVGKDDTGASTVAAITLEPELLDFGEVAPGETVVESFYVGNSGGEALAVEDVRIFSGAGDFVILTETVAFSLGPGEQREIVVAFEPSDGEPATDTVIVSSSDAARPEATVSLTGNGEPVDPELELSLDPASHDFGEVTVGSWRDHEIALINSGESVVEVSEVAITGEAFSLGEGAAYPITLAAGESVGIQVIFSPEAEGAFEGSLEVSTEDGEEVSASLEGTGVAPETVVETFEAEEPAVDLLFLADQSGSMDSYTATLGAAFGDFITDLSGITTDWQVMVVNDDDGCTDSGILTPSTPNYADTFRTAIRAGGGSYTEALLSLAALALQSTDPGECNHGFLREDALLHVVMISDEPEQSSQGWSYYVAEMQAAKTTEQQLRLSAVAGDYPGGCGSASPGTGYYEAVQATGGAYVSICASGTVMAAELAEAAVWRWFFELTQEPDPGTLEVFVDGAARPAGWEWEEASNAVIFNADYPSADTVVRIEYTAR